MSFPTSLVSKIATAVLALGSLSFQASAAGNFDNSVNVAIPDESEKLWVGGDFGFVDGIPRTKIARLNPGTELEDEPDLAVDRAVRCITRLDDGSTLLGGDLLAIDGVAHRGLAKLAPDGTVDTAFNADVDGIVTSVSPLAGGQILISGSFTAVGGVPRTNIARLNQDGSLDSTFVTNVNSIIHCHQLLDSGKILIGGQFSQVDGVTQRCLARLEADGSRDASFTTSTNSTVFCMTAQADGKILLGGLFTTVGGGTRQNLARLEPDGLVAPTLNFSANGPIHSLVVQADGKILASGSFTTVLGTTTRNRIVRLTSTGALDSFNPSIGGTGTVAWGIALSRTGEVIATGSFPTLSSSSFTNFCSFTNNIAATSTLSFADPTTLRWMRGGSSPETSRVIFDFRPDGSTTWMPLGAGVRIAGGWELSGIEAPGDGIVRARAVVRGGRYSGSSGMVQALLQSGPSLPAVAVTDSHGAAQVNGSAIHDFGGVLQGAPRKATFHLKNDGMGVMTDLAVSLTGPDTSSFSIVTRPPAALLPGESARITVQFRPSSAGAKSCTLQLASNDPAANPFAIQLTGQGTTILSPTFGGPNDIPIASPNFSPSGLQFGTLTLGFAPPPGTILTVVDRPGTSNLPASFTDLIHGQYISAQFAGTTYEFLVNYRGGTGNDLVLMLRGAGVVAMAFTAQLTGWAGAIAPLPDGTVLVSGSISASLGDYQFGSLLKLRQDGTPDPSFLASIKSGSAATISVQPDGMILIGGAFPKVNGTTKANLARLRPDGSLDASFLTETDGTVLCIRIDSQGRILIAGDFTQVAGSPRSRIARLMPDGSLDASFDPVLDGAVRSLLVLPDERILVGGEFGNVDSHPIARLALLTPEGVVDERFQPQPDAQVTTLVALPDGGFVAGGDFTKISGSDRLRLARFNADASLEGGFNPGANGIIRTAMLQANGVLLVGGEFTECAGSAQAYFAALNLNGGLAPAFARSLPNGNVHAIAADYKGRTLVGGAFTSINAWDKRSLARFDATVGTATTLTRPASNLLSWQRGGSLTETFRAIFEHLPSGASSWVPLGSGVRTSEGWELSSEGLPETGTFRVRAQSRGAGGGNSEGLASEWLAPGEGNPAFSLLRKIGDPLVTNISTVDAGKAMDGYPQLVSLVIANTGSARLSGITATVSGTDAATFQLVMPPLAELQPGEFTSFTISFQPTGNGIRNARVEVTAQPLGTQAFSVNLRGEGTGNTFYPVFNTPADVALDATNFNPQGRTLANPLLGFAPQTGTTLTLVNERNSSYYSSDDFANALEGAYVTAYHGTTPYQFLLGYHGGSDNDIILTRRGPGVLDPSFAPTISSIVNAFATQPDGKILVGGQSSGQLMRLNANGSADAGFWYVSTSDSVSAIAVQTDGKILVGGSFTSITGGTRNRIARLQSHGELDYSFNANANGSVSQISILPGEKILLTGSFTAIGGVPCPGIARLLPDGTLDATFQPQTNGAVTSTLLLPDGKLVVAGDFDASTPALRKRLMRLHANGSRDAAFTCTFTNTITRLAKDPSGAILVNGVVADPNLGSLQIITRLHPDGSFDRTIGGTYTSILPAISCDSAGKILLCGDITSGRQITKFLPSGEPDSGFVTGLHFPASSANTLPSGKILACGLMIRVNGLYRYSFAMLENESGSASVETPDLSTVRLRPSGAYPEALRVAFELKQGSNWLPLGDGLRTASGWQLSNTSLPANGTVRARAFLPNGRNGSSSGLSDYEFTYAKTPTALENWRLTHFGAAGNSGNGADDQDPDSDGLANLIEYAFGLSPMQAGSAGMPAWTLGENGISAEFQAPAGASGVTYRADWSATLADGDWTEIPDSGSGNFHRFQLAQPGQTKIFVRLRVVRP